MLLKIIEDLGMRFPSETAKRKRRYVKCECDCGNVVEVRKDQLKDIKSCGCARNEPRTRIHKERKLDSVYIGKKFGRWTLIEDLGIRDFDTYRKRYVKVKCDCNDIIHEKPFDSILRGFSQSCGCLHKERASENCKEVGKGNLQHGMDGSKIYKLWTTMKGRCNTSTITGYERYGGRGIKVCDEWQNFEPFYKWALENGYEEGLSIDRIDNDGNYEPSNCQWLTLAENTKKMHEDKKKRNDDDE